MQGLASDGGLVRPGSDAGALVDGLSRVGAALPAIAERLIAPFADGDPLAAELGAICEEAFDFPAPLVRLERARGGAQRARAVSRSDLRVQGLRRPLHGGRARTRAPRARIGRSRSSSPRPAIPAAPSPRPSIGGRGSTSSCSIPTGLVSPRQAQQLACWGENVRTFAVRGTFDDCQRVVKEAFRDPRAVGGASASRRRTASTSDGCCRRWCTTRRRAWRSGSARGARPTSSCRPAIWAT